jgi:ectoine hydroxylase-related dioxygenase (phytanoyl-CoA dioxygenase family)
MSTTLTAPSVVTEAHQKQFKEDGYMILERCVPEEHLQLLRDSSTEFIAQADAEMDAQKVSRLGLNAKGKRYFVANCYKQKPELGKFIFSELMAEICRTTIGGEAMLFWDQYVIKGTDKDSSFSWHQDAGYVNLECPEYLTCWVALDDVTLENGTVYVLPYSECGIRTVVQHKRDPRTNDLVGYFGKEPGVPAIVPAGSIVVFSSYVFHRSGPNLTDKLRRVYLPQYSPTPILNKEGKPWGQTVPFLKNGEIVWTEGS